VCKQARSPNLHQKTFTNNRTITLKRGCLEFAFSQLGSLYPPPSPRGALQKSLHQREADMQRFKMPHSAIAPIWIQYYKNRQTRKRCARNTARKGSAPATPPPPSPPAARFNKLPHESADDGVCIIDGSHDERT